MNVFKWNSIGSEGLPTSSGIYAWYYKPKIGKADVSNLTSELSSTSSISDKRKLVSSFLNQRLFRFFSQPDYYVTANGPLMPKFSGSIQHIDQISNDLINKIVEDPNAIHLIRDILLELDINFLSPIYVGMAKNLSQRINIHKSLIESEKTGYKLEGDFEERDRCFAERVAQRKMVETYLEVVVCGFDSKNNEHNLAENLVNRISYPVLGRN